MEVDSTKLIEYLDRRLAILERNLVKGTCGGGPTVEGQMTNYRAAVQRRDDLIALKDAVLELVAGKTPAVPEENEGDKNS